MNGRQLGIVTVVAGMAWWWWSRVRPLTPSVSTSTTFALDVTPQIRAVAQAIARAEGYYVSGSIPNRANNPGDLVLGDRGLGVLGEGITVFNSAADGWNALYNQLVLIINGQSSNYTLDMSIGAMGQVWSGGSPNWASNVAAALGVPTITPLYEVLL